MRELARRVAEELPDAPCTYTNRLIEGRIAFLEWIAQALPGVDRSGGGRPRARRGDSLVIEDGRIVAHTIHYTVEPK